tara:strand:- start:16053 stop:16655 length:603 start_codon:yes stop_codon:yes gene_type:complete
VKQIPYILIYSRIVFAILIVLLLSFSFVGCDNWVVGLMVLAILTDVFDGIIARQIGVSSERLRVLDSNVDQFFWLVTIVSVFYNSKEFILSEILWIGIIVFLELSTYIVSYFKFRRTIATHSILAKFWTISLLIFLIDLVLHNQSFYPFIFCVVLGIISRIEILLITLRLKQWVTDVPSIFSVSKLNRGEEIKRNKLFNG